MIVSAFTGTTPPPSIIGDIEAGRVGGVILFGGNLQGEAQTKALTARLQRAARAGRNPPLLIMTDQEGGEVKRLPWAPPALAPSGMGSTATAGAEGAATGRALRAAGVNVDLAPVADVIRVRGSFLGSRSFGTHPKTVGPRACAFAVGVGKAKVGYTLKHFPGLGRAQTTTDVQRTVVSASAAKLRADYEAYRRCGRRERAIVMISSAIYPSITGDTPAVLSREVYATELPHAVGGRAPLTISDNLQAPGLYGQEHVARRAAGAGLDLLMYASSEDGAKAAYRELLAAVRSGQLSRRRVESADAAIAAMKRAIR